MVNRIYLLRHGENPANITKEFSSRIIDYSLTEKGRLQAQQTAEWFINRDIHAVYSSPLKRARETAEIIADRLGQQVILMDYFREIEVGYLEGHPPTQEAWDFYLQTVIGWIDGRKEVRFPGGENYVELWARFTAGLCRVLAGRENQNLLIVGHGGIFTVPLPELCPTLDIDMLRTREFHNCAISTLLIEQSEGKLVGRVEDWAFTGHLSGEAAELVTGVMRKS